MRIDLSDLERLDGIAEALGRLFWCLIVAGFFTAILGSAGTGLLVLILAGAAFVVRVGLEDFARSRREPTGPATDSQITIHRTAGARRSTRQQESQRKQPQRPRRPAAR